MLPESLASSRALAAFGLVCAILAVYAFLWGAVKLAWQRVTGTPMPRTRLTIGLDIGADVAVNVLGAVSRTLKLTGGSALFWPTLPTAPPRPEAPPASSQAGHIRAAGLGLVFLVAVAGYTLRCRPNLPPVSGCTPYTRRCTPDGYTEVCSASQRWHRDGDVPCSRIEQVCVAGACVDPPDASLPADGDASTDGGAR